MRRLVFGSVEKLKYFNSTARDVNLPIRGRPFPGRNERLRILSFIYSAALSRFRLLFSGSVFVATGRKPPSREAVDTFQTHMCPTLKNGSTH
jgi:hypothetical protein